MNTVVLVLLLVSVSALSYIFGMANGRTNAMREINRVINDLRTALESHTKHTT